jgi:hypothetical protein
VSQTRTQTAKRTAVLLWNWCETDHTGAQRRNVRNGFLQLFIGLTLVSPTVAPAATDAQPSPQEYPGGYTYRLAYTEAPSSGAITPQALPTPGPPSLVDQAGVFLTHPSVDPRLPNNAVIRPLVVPAPTPNENWSRFSLEDLNNAISPLTSPAGPSAMLLTLEQAKIADLCNFKQPVVGSPAAAWDVAYRIIAIHGACANVNILGNSANSRSLVVVEPRIPTELEGRANDYTVTIQEQSSRAWPFPQVDPNPTTNETAAQFWHRGKSFAELDLALDRMRELAGPLDQVNDSRVVIAHLDTGYPDPNQVSGYPLPSNFRKDWSVDCYEPVLHNENVTCRAGAGQGIDISSQDPTFTKTSWFLTTPLHGAGTLSILAGPFWDHPDAKCEPANSPHWGANPCAEIFEVRIGQSFAHFNEESMSRGIVWAVQHNADVISLSHGGVPAAVLASAVNYAYLGGTPIFAASGDYFGSAFLSTPKTVVFPARYSQVMNVTGVTADYRSGGAQCPLILCIWHFGGGNGFWQNFKEWHIGTNFGPATIMAGHSIAAYTPNITFFNSELSHPGLSNDEDGTSAAVPQAAAAASMWLQVNQDSIKSANDWRSWRKTEAVYQAMTNSSRHSNVPGFTDAQFASYSAAYFGAGLLNARSMLDTSYTPPPDCQMRSKSTADLFWWADAVDSSTVLYVLGLQPTQILHDITAPFSEASRTELSQIAFRSEKLANLLSEIGIKAAQRNCASAASDLSKITSQEWRRLRQLVGANKYSSNTLNATVSAVIRRYQR